VSGEHVVGERQYNRVLGWVRNLLVYLLVAFLLWQARPTPVSVAAGFVLVVLGEAVRFWAAGHLYKTQKLITSGPYRYTRNPLYLGRLLIFTGVTVMADLPLGPTPHLGSALLLVVGWAIFFGYYLRRKERVEPARLEEVHGEPYRRYFEAVPALFPRLSPWEGASREPWRSERMLRNREQWMVVGLLLLSAFLLWRATA
jgi:protein-S-isoprenylcysteine O-methyltransferase Ste14